MLRLSHRTNRLAVWLVAAAYGCNDASSTSAPSLTATDAGPADAAPPPARDSGSARPASNAAAHSDAGAQPAADGGKSAHDAAEAASRAVTIHFRAVVGGDDFACGQNYRDQGSSHVTVTPYDLRMYIQDIELVSAGGESTRVTLDDRSPWQSADVALLDFEDGSAGCSGDSATNHMLTGRVRAGDYAAISFSVGVPEALNHAQQDTLPDPLHEPGMSWNWLLGFRFLKAEIGEVAATADADGGIGGGTFHLGSVGCSGNASAGTITCSKPNRNRVKLDGWNDASEIVFDVGALFAGMDLSKDSECHSADAICESGFRSFGIDYASGAAAATQSAFRLQDTH